MTLPNPYEAPQSDVLNAEPAISRKKLPAIVGVGASICFWAWLLSTTLHLICSGLDWYGLSVNQSKLYQLLWSLVFWAGSIATLLGTFLLYQAPQETGAKGFFKWYLILFFSEWSWHIVVSYEANPQEIPVAIHWAFHLAGTLGTVCFYAGFWHLSHYCEDDELIYWSRIALFLGIVTNMLSTVEYGLRYILPMDWLETFDQQRDWGSSYADMLRYILWILWVPLTYFLLRAIWRVSLHADNEVTPLPPADQKITGTLFTPVLEQVTDNNPPATS
jgi:hypothetical protein